MLVFCIFLPVFKNGFVWDDYDNLLANHHYRGLGWEQLTWMLTNFHMGLYQPFSWLSYGLDYSLWGMNPVGYHLTNLVLHTTNVLLVYILVLRLFPLVRDSAKDMSATGIGLWAALAAALFGLHPLRVESVAWATERRDVLSGLFFLLSLNLYLAFARRDSGPRKQKLFVASAATYALSLLSKPGSVGFPLILLTLDWYPLRRQEGFKELLREKMPFIAAALAACVLAPIAMAKGGSILSWEQYGALPRIIQFLTGLSFYLWKTFWPLNLSPLYLLRPAEVIEAGSWPVIFSAVAVSLSIITTAVLGRQRWPWATVAWVFYMLLLVPVSGLAQNGPQFAADRYSYLSCLPWPILTAMGLSYLYRTTGQRLPLPTRTIPFLCLAVIAAISILTIRQIRVWRDAESLWEHALIHDPKNYFAHYNLAHAQERAGRLEDAAGHYQQAIKQFPDNPANVGIYSRLGNLSIRGGRLQQARRYYDAALRIDPWNADILNDLGNLLSQQGQHEQAIKAYERAFQSEPENMALRGNLVRACNIFGRMLGGQKKLREAAEQFRLALRYESGNVEAHYNLAGVLHVLGKNDLAIEHYDRVLSAQPDNAAAHYNLYVIYRKLGKTQQAALHYQQAVRLGLRP